MDCREFRNNHVAFVDDLLPALTMDAMERHLAKCPRCARTDSSIRRSLFLVRNLRPIEPSADFMARLNARLDGMEPTSRVDVVSRPYLPSVGAFAAFAAGVAAVAYMTIETTRYFSPTRDLPLASVVASSPDFGNASMANTAFVASVPTGIPVWPAVLMIGQAPMHFASLDFHDGDITR